MKNTAVKSREMTTFVARCYPNASVPPHLFTCACARPNASAARTIMPTPSWIFRQSHPRFEEHLQNTLSLSQKIRVFSVDLSFEPLKELALGYVSAILIHTHEAGGDFVQKLHVHRQCPNYALSMGLNQTEMEIHMYLHVCMYVCMYIYIYICCTPHI